MILHIFFSCYFPCRFYKRTHFHSVVSFESSELLFHNQTTFSEEANSLCTPQNMKSKMGVRDLSHRKLRQGTGTVFVCVWCVCVVVVLPAHGTISRKCRVKATL